MQAGLSTVGAWLGAWLGGLDGLIYALIAFVIADYITGVLAAVSEKRVNSTIGFRGISRKIIIFTLIGLAHLLDTRVLGTPGVLRTTTVIFYLSNDGISVVENAARLGLPIPPPIRDALDVINDTSDCKKPAPSKRKEKTDEELNHPRG